MLRRACGQGLGQAACRVGGNDAGQAGITRYLSAYLGDAPRRLDVPGLLHLMEYGKEVRRAQFGNGAGAQLREGVNLQPPQDAGSMAGRPFAELLCVPFPRHLLKGQRGRRGFNLCGLAFGAGVYATRKQLLCRYGTDAGILERDERIGPQGKELFLSAVAILEPPELSPVGETRTYSPPPSVSFQGFSFGFAVLMAVSVSFWGIRGISKLSGVREFPIPCKNTPIFCGCLCTLADIGTPLKQEKPASL